MYNTEQVSVHFKDPTHVQTTQPIPIEKDHGKGLGS